MMWQIRQIEAFQAVMLNGSITRAATTLHVSQPAISKLVAELERKCGFKLFQRQGNRLTVTAEGQLLYNEVQRMIVSSENIQLKVREIREQRFGTLNIAAFPALSTRLLPGIITRFVSERPNVRPLLTSSSSRFLNEWVAAQRSDLGIGLLGKSRPDIRLVKMMQVEGVCALPPGHFLQAKEIITPSDFDEQPFVSLTTEDRTQFLVEEFFRGRERSRKIVAEAQMSEAACQFVVERAGISIVDPFSAMGFSPDELTTKKIDPPVLFDMWLIFPMFQPISLITRSFTAFFDTEIQRELTRRQMMFIPYDYNIPD
ncbi:MAG: LysR family transcriptional regulator [Candidimonas sp.]|nr:MAG: LysR family transcriptional regulator [Candidimonas sp.]TAM24932.1 MAG: LysR family transcriptional regulator [Candidimonas sp.]TAM74038.1 MAG: LysR family transcriptional regulator [Candidimonas sp.]